MGDRPPPAPWAEELKARTNPGAQPFTKAPAVAPKFGGRTVTSSSSSLAQKINQNLNQNQTTPPMNSSPKPPPPTATISFPPAPAAPPAPPAPPNNMAAPPAPHQTKTSPFKSPVNANQNLPAAVPPPQPKSMASPPSSFSQPMKTSPSSTVGCSFFLARTVKKEIAGTDTGPSKSF